VSTGLESDPDAYALVLDVANVDAGFPGSESLGETTIGARSQKQESLFIGLAATPKVDEYLSGVAYDVIRHEGSLWETATVPGTKKPEFPKDEKFWTRRSTGSAPNIDFKQAPGKSTTFVIMNTDASKAVSAKVLIGYESSLIFPLALAAIGVGAVLILIPLILGYLGKRKRAKKRASVRIQPTVNMPQGSAAATQVAASGPVPEPAARPATPPPPQAPGVDQGQDDKPLNELDKWFRDGGRE
jgi:hypothetical protein